MAELRRSPLLGLLIVVPFVFVVEARAPEAHTLLFLLSFLAIVPLSVLLSRATESVAAHTGDTVGGLVNATFGNMVELVVVVVALRAGDYLLLKASLAGVIVANTLFNLGLCLLIGGLRHRMQAFNASAARLQSTQLFIATIAMLVPSLMRDVDSPVGAQFLQLLSLALAVLLIATYALGLVFSLRTHRALFQGAASENVEESVWPLAFAAPMLVGVTLVVALTSEIFVASVQHAAVTLGLNRAFVGFVLVALVGGAAEMTAAVSAASKDRLDLSLGIALGSATQIALFVVPLTVLASHWIGPVPLDLQFWPGAVLMMLIATVVASMVANAGRSTWFSGVLVLAVYLIFAITLFLMPPRTT